MPSAMGVMDLVYLRVLLYTPMGVIVLAIRLLLSHVAAAQYNL
jgi:hypothetical protein